MSPELLTAVKERLELGHSLDSIREEMRQAGHADEVIEAAIAEAKGDPSHVSPIPTGGTNPLPGAWMLFKAGAVFMWQRLDLVAAMAAPLVILVLLDYLFTYTLDETTAGTAIILSSIVGIIIYIVLTIAALYIVTQAERRVTLAEAFAWTRERFWALVWVYVLVSLAVWGGLLLLVIPGVILSLYLYFAMYVFIVEDVRGFPALLRSRTLVWGHWWHLFWRLLGLIFIFLLVFIVLGISAALLFGLAGELGDFLMEIVGQVFSVAGALIGMYVAAQWYHTLAAIRPSTSSAAPEQMPDGETKYKVLTWLGVVALLAAIIGVVWVARAVDDWSALDAASKAPSYEAKDRAVELRETDTF